MLRNDESSRPTEEKIDKETDEINAKERLSYTRALFGFLGLLPYLGDEKITRQRQILMKLIIFVTVILLLFPVTPTAIYMITREKDFIAKLVLFGPIGFLVVHFLKYLFIIGHIETIKQCIDIMKNDWKSASNEDEREIVARNANNGKRLTIISGSFMYTGGISLHTIVPFLSPKMTNEFNDTLKPVVYPGFDLFVDAQSTPFYELIYIITTISAIYGYTVFTLSANLTAIFVTHACGQLEIVTSRLNKLIEDVKDFGNIAELQNRIAVVVECHSRVLRLSTDIERVLREICLLEVSSSVFIGCILEYCVMDWNSLETMTAITYLVLLCSLIFNIFIFCYIGELLQTQCTRVGISSYMTNWYDLPGKTGHALVMIIAMAKYPYKITAGGILDLTIANFGAIMKTSLVYMNMLQTVTE